MATGTTVVSSLTRDQIIEQAYKLMGVLGEGESLSDEMLQDGAMSLGQVVRELSDEDLHPHTLITTTITLQANIFAYAASNGLPTDIAELVTVRYRDTNAQDWPVDLVTREQYEQILTKTETGEPKQVFLTEGLAVSGRTLYVHPALSEVNTQDVVTGSDASAYKCIKTHVATTDNKPITGDNWRLYWELGGSGAVAWVSGDTYEAPELLRVTYERPLYNFDLADDTMDFPYSHGRMLKCLLAVDMAPGFGLPLDRIAWIQGQADTAYRKVFKRSMRKKTTKTHNFAKYY